MLVSDRRKFLRSSAATALSLTVPADWFAQAASAAAPGSATWDAGGVRHLLPTVSDTRMLIKMSFGTSLMEAPTLSVGGTSVRGRIGDTRGEHWHFYVTDLKPQHRYTLSLAGALRSAASGRADEDMWDRTVEARAPGADDELEPRQAVAQPVKRHQTGAIRPLHRAPGEALLVALVDDLGLPI